MPVPGALIQAVERFETLHDQRSSRRLILYLVSGDHVNPHLLDVSRAARLSTPFLRRLHDHAPHKRVVCPGSVSWSFSVLVVSTSWGQARRLCVLAVSQVLCPKLPPNDLPGILCGKYARRYQRAATAFRGCEITRTFEHHQGNYGNVQITRRCTWEQPSIYLGS